MPPDPPLPEENYSADEPPPLTDQNVRILYKIIETAEQYPEVETLPFRAIFAAYESVLPENGLDPDHDQIYLRFLFRLGDRREEGQSLYESFEALLEELEFQIEFISEDEGTQGAATSLGAQRNAEATHAQARDHKQISRRPRRASFNTTYDAEDESTRALRRRPRSRASMSRIDVSQRSIMDTRPSTRATTRKTEKTSYNASPSKPAASQSRRGRLTAEEVARNLQHRQRRNISVSSHLGRRMQQPAEFRDPQLNAPSSALLKNDHALGSTDDAEDNSIEVSTSPQPTQPAYASGHHEGIYNPSRTQLVRDAETFHQYRIRSIAHDVVDRWCYAALHAKDRHEHLDRLAAAHDTEILLRQAFEHWRLRLHAKKQAADTESYFSHQERRISRARDLMLLSKAFTHWAQCASEERLRTSDARRKIISMKYFAAWHNITISNQRNVRHKGLRKFFGIWKQRYIRSLADVHNANLVRKEMVCTKAYWAWFWAFCERRAPEWRAGRLRRKYLSQWTKVLRSNRQREQHTVFHLEDTIRRKVLFQWLEKAQVVLHGQRQAASFRKHQEASHALNSWKFSYLNAPSLRRISNMVDWRVAGATFAIFITRYRFERQAEVVNRLRIMRNVWTQWNDRLRLQTVTHRIDDRYCLEALYRWVVAERAILFHRLSQERVKQRFLYKLRDECTARCLQRTQSRDVFEDLRRKRLLRYYLACWGTQLFSYRQDERVAFEFCVPRLAQEAMRPWAERLTHLQAQNKLAKDVEYFYVSRRLVKRWHAACLESKRQKRKNAYMQIRRKSKMGLAASVLQQWRFISSRTLDMQLQADSNDRDRLLKIGTKFFDLWVDRSTVGRDQDYQASQHYERRLVERHLYTWIERLEDQSRLEELAEVNHDMRIKNIAFSWFNKLRLKIIESKGQEANAENLRSWYEKRHFRSMLRKWQDNTTKKLDPHEEAAISSRAIRTRPKATAVDDGPTSRAEDWTDFDIGDWIPALEAQSNTTPLPGYLSTPSKRAARAKALVRVSTTPVGTPFEQRLRSQIGSTPRTARRVAFGRSSTVLRGNTFGAILEDSPRTPGMDNGE